MKVDPKEPVIVVRTEVFGRRASRIMEMALDTGSTYVIIPWKVVESLGYDPAVSKMRMPLVTASTTEVVPLITVKSISALGCKADNVLVACHDLPPRSRVDGLLGLSFLKEFDIDLYFKKGLLKLRDP